jgi:hypothetical protein
MCNIPCKGYVTHNIQSRLGFNYYWYLTNNKFSPFHHLTEYGTYKFYRVFYSEEEVEIDYQKRQSRAEAYVNKYNLNSWWSVAQIINMSFSEWNQLTPNQQMAIHSLAEETQRAKDRMYNEQKKQHELALMEKATELKFPSPISNNISRYLS